MKKKVLYLTTQLSHYRVPILNIVAQQPNFQLTVAHTGPKKVTDEANFSELIISEGRKGPLIYCKEDLFALCSQFDVVVVTESVLNISYLKLILSRKRNFKIFTWGIGVRASYNHTFDSKGATNYIRRAIAKYSDGMIFYSDYARQKYINKYGVSADKLFVMANTVEVDADFVLDPSLKQNILFIGTLYKQKKVFELLEAYYKAYLQNNQVNNLVFVGDGPEKTAMKAWVKEHRLEDKVQLLGGIYEAKEKVKVFDQTIACISPGQAGLSVLECFGYGVPFITHKDAITGGERLNITHNETGAFFEDYEQLTDIILAIQAHKQAYIEMGQRALHYYHEQRTPAIMAQGFIDAVNSVVK